MSLVSLSINSATATITLNRQEKRNALSPELVRAITDSFNTLEKDDSVAIIILSGGEKVFCAGADLTYLKQLSEQNSSQHLDDSTHLANMFLAVNNSSKITIAAVNGYALAGGCGLATACDFVFANSVSAALGYTEVKIGFLAAIVGKFLINRVGLQKAQRLLLTGEIINASQALEIGLADEVSDNPIEEAEEFAETLLKNSHSSLLASKQLLKDISHLPINRAVELAVNRNVISRATPDFTTGIQSFLKK